MAVPQGIDYTRIRGWLLRRPRHSRESGNPYPRQAFPAAAAICYSTPLKYHPPRGNPAMATNALPKLIALIILLAAAALAPRPAAA